MNGFTCPVCGAKPAGPAHWLPQCEHVVFGDDTIAAFAWKITGGPINVGRYATLIQRLLELGFDLNTVTRDAVRAVALTLEE